MKIFEMIAATTTDNQKKPEHSNLKTRMSFQCDICKKYVVSFQKNFEKTKSCKF